MELINNILGLDVEKLEPYQMASRAVVIFFISLILVRIGGIRTFGKQSIFDTLSTLMLGAILGRCIVADQSFFGSILATLILMLLHRLIALLTYKSKKLGKIFKGENIILMKNGKMLKENLARSQITENDIMDALRREMQINSLDRIKEVHLERSGDISFISIEK